MKIIVKTVNKEEIEILKPVEFSFNDSMDAACSSFSFSYKNQRLDEVVEVKVYHQNKLIFFGYCDCQREELGKNGTVGYIYSRSSACLLLDNEAKPFTYNKITANSLCEKYAGNFGFKSKLPNIFYEDMYQVTKGTSCYGAINQFVSLLTGGRIYVTPENEIVYLEKSKNTKGFEDFSIISCSFVTNRSEPLSNIKFKKSVSVDQYNLNTMSQQGKSLMFNRTKLVNLSSFPLWQRENTVLQKLKNSYKRYKLIELTVQGYADEELGQMFSGELFGEKICDYMLDDIKYTSDKSGEKTRLTLRKIIDVKEITYVD